jgi:hypothetical protein
MLKQVQSRSVTAFKNLKAKAPTIIHLKNKSPSGLDIRATTTITLSHPSGYLCEILILEILTRILAAISWVNGDDDGMTTHQPTSS